MDYKDTLLLPKTAFPMRGNLPQNEPKKYTKWFDEKVYDRMKKNREGKKKFTLHDGPPYANGNTHIGHALNKILKDIVVKTHYFNAEDVRFTPGWDCHGLPIEQQVEKKLGKSKKEALEKSKIRELCREHASKFVDIQRDEFKELGITADWENPYLTSKYNFEANIYRTLTDIAKNGLLTQRSKPVYWSWAARTALAEAEVEYEDKEDFSIYVAFKCSENALKALGVKEASIVIWTTTPWTLPANVGISLNPEFDYILSSDGFVVAKDLYESLKELGVLSGDIKKTFKADILENTKAINPLNNRESLLILGDHVTSDGGTGCVHTAPGHGEEDYKVGLKYDLEVVMPVDERGCFDETVSRLKLLPQEFVGEHIFKSNEKILDILGDALLHQSKFIHSYPFCWRTHKPVIYRATKQWFISMDEKFKDNKTLRELAIEAIDEVEFLPSTGIKRLLSMVENRPDWCISRQRDWGVPIAFFIHKKTGEVIFDEKVLNFVAMIFENEGCDAWWDRSIEELLYPGSGYAASDLEKVTDILDVWFDSGSTFNSVIKSGDYDAGEFPASLYLEGSDQHRGWFQSSLLVALSSGNKAPYKKILTHGFTVDSKGEKMSKSKGNVVAPKKILNQYGSEILRLWVANSDYTRDLKISDDIVKQIGEQYKKIRNTLRFLLANIDGLESICEAKDFGVLDKWILSLGLKTLDEVQANFRDYDYAKGVSTLMHFVAVELSGIYLDISKDKMYCNAKSDIRRVATSSVMAILLKKMMITLAPILTYTIDEVLEYAPSVVSEGASDVFDFNPEILDYNENVDIDYLLGAREKFFESIDVLKKDKVIKSTLELSLVSDSQEFLRLDNEDVVDWFSVSNVMAQSNSSEILASFSVGEDEFKIVYSDLDKCPRCWKQNLPKQKELCSRCESVVNV